jgi:hypothetical protein
MTYQLSNAALPAPGSIPDVRKSVRVDLPIDAAFALFTAAPTTWWPPSHCLLGDERRAEVVIEPTAGGRYFDRGVTGREVDWGTVRDFNAPYGLTMSWRIDGRFQPVDSEELASAIEVTFEPREDDDTTRVQLAHVELWRHGVYAEAIHTALEGASPGETLARYASAAIEMKRCSHAFVG